MIANNLRPPSGKFRLCLIGLLLIVAIDLSLFEISSIVSPGAEAIPKRGQRIHEAPFPGLQPPSPRHAGRRQAEGHEFGGEALGWAIPYGKEFWRRAIKPGEPRAQDAKGSSTMLPANNIDLGDIIDRVSHAITKDETNAVPRVLAKTYTAAFDGSGARFSPHRPGNRELPLMDPEDGLRDGRLDTANEIQSMLIPSAPFPSFSSAPFPPFPSSPFREDEKSLLRRAAATQRSSARITPTGYPRPDPDTEVTLRTRSVRLGDRVLYEQCAQPLGWSLHGNTAQALLNERIGLVEHWETGGEGIHVSWVLTQNPLKSLTQSASCPFELDRGDDVRQATRLSSERASASDSDRSSSQTGAGGTPALLSRLREDIEIEFEIEGLRYSGVSEQGIHLADAMGTPRVRIGKAEAVDSLGRRAEVPIQADDGRVYLRLSREVLAQSTYPLAIDPLISPEFAMDQPVTVPEPGFHHLPAAASNGTNWLVVWTEWHAIFDSPVDVVAARVSSEGRVLDPFGILISKEEDPPAAPAVASNGKDYFVVWQHFNPNSGHDIYGARVRVDGRLPNNEAIVISTPGDQIAASVAGGSDGYFVVWQVQLNFSSDLDVYGTRVSNEGVVLDGDGFPITKAPGHQSSPSVANGPEGFLVVWGDSRDFSARGDDIYGARIDSNGTVLDTNGIAICTATRNQWFPTLAANSTGYLVAWQDSRSTGNVEENDIYAALVSRAGVVSPPQGMAVRAATGNQARPSVAASASDFLVVWKDSKPLQSGVYASRVSPTGVVLDSEGLVVNPGEVAFAARAAANDNTFLVVWDRTGSGIWGARLNSRAEVIDSEDILITAKDNDQNSPAVAFNGEAWLVVWWDWRNPGTTDIYGVRIGYNGTTLDTAATRISTQPGFEFDPTVASAGGDYLVVWTDRRNFASNQDDIYGARLRGDGTAMDPGGIPIRTAPGFQFNPVVASDGTNYLVVSQDRNDIYATRVSQDGVVLEPDGLPIITNADSQGIPAVAFNGKDFLVVWTEWRERANSNDDIFGARVSTDGVVLDPAGISISRAAYAQSLPAVASSGSDFLVIWADTRNTTTSGGSTYGGEIYGARVNSEGRVLEPEGFLISTSAFRAHPALSFNGTDYLAVWDGCPGPCTSGQIRAAWIDRGGKVLLKDLSMNSDGGYPAVAAGPSNSFLVVSEGLRNGAFRVSGNVVYLADTPIVQSLAVTAAAAKLTWCAEGGKAYRVQFTPDLSNTNWIDLDPIVTATNIAASLLDPTIGPDSQRFYRVLRMP